MCESDPGEREVTALFEELQQPLRRYFLVAGLSIEDADEGVQETFLPLHRRRGAGGGRANLRGWIFQVARNMARNEFKAARRRLTETLTGDTFADPRGTPEDHAIERERFRRFDTAMQ